MKNSGIKERPGCSWIQGKKGTHTFFVGDGSHPQSQQTYALLGTLMEQIKALGYVPQTDFALHDVDDGEKKLSFFLNIVKNLLLPLAYSPSLLAHPFRSLGICVSVVTITVPSHLSL